MKIFNVLVSDRHKDPEIYNFRFEADALAFARKVAKEHYSLKNINEEQIAEWILFIETSCEGDYIRVTIGDLK